MPGSAEPHIDFLGVAAALTTSVLWTFTGLLFAAGTRRIGAAVVNSSRLGIACCLHLITFRLFTGHFWPEMSTFQLWALVLSGVVGLALCDQCWLVSLADLGPRRVMLLATTSPIFALLLGTLVLHERIAPAGLLGIALTLAGIIWVVLERRSGADAQKHPHVLRGTVLAIVAAALQALGSLFSKAGMGEGVAQFTTDQLIPVTPQGASLTRMFFGFLGALPILALVTWRHGTPFPKLPAAGSTGAAPIGGALESPTTTAATLEPDPVANEETHGEASNPLPPTSAAATLPPYVLEAGPRGFLDRLSPRQAGFLFAACGSITGPYLGVWFSLVAFKLAPLGIAQTLLSLQPVLVLPLAATILKDKVTPRAVLGALVAVGGSVVLAIWGRGG